jgi:hypothetical protein
VAGDGPRGGSSRMVKEMVGRRTVVPEAPHNG